MSLARHSSFLRGNKMHTANLLVLLPCFVAAAHQPLHDDVQLSERAAGGILDSGMKDNHVDFMGDAKQAFFLETQRIEKNVTMESIHDRSLELVGRQSCNTGYFACPAAGGCCLNSRRCCTYGYCMDTGNTCCPGGSCAPGNTCCGVSTCNPIGTQCCSDGNYCSEGNICVIYSGRRVCCTDLSCTAYISNGATISSTRAAAPTTTTRAAATITPPPTTTTTRVIANQYETWYYTVTWWYFSYYWTTIRAESTVTYTTIYSTTTYTTTALDRADASSRFAVLSSSLTFTPPASATSLKSLFGAVASDTPTPIARIGSTRAPTPTSALETPSGLSFPLSPTGTRVGTTGQANTLLSGWNVCIYTILSSVLSLVL
ncbi:hypothetical protein DE146DRAFT_325995 [Phaeosphaeria sp. MPI-PUGE-AT-0046c]|nr:hypothetical protein DE146DRAFT_325995 [Phaeosphaeria sp. MPI-PUGE-AT-0046c]